jgi:predicted nucleotidyltransferase component of viral defense system
VIPSKERILASARETAFDAVLLEKVYRLLDLLEGMRDHPYLKGRWVLKGGTALNLFQLDVPRLSVDVDVNYVGSADREVMRAERPVFEKALQAVFARHGLTVRRSPDAGEHAGGKWSLRYESALGQGGNLEVDLNYLLRVPLWPATTTASRELGGVRVDGIPILDVHELAGGKLAALLSRHAARDLFDAHLLLADRRIDPERLRTAFVVYGAINRKDWRTVKVSDADFEARELRDQLLPLLRDGAREVGKSPDAWAKRLVKECRSRLKAVLPLTDPEKKFLDGILERGEIDAALLTRDSALAGRITNHPGLGWKALNVREYKRKR